MSTLTVTNIKATGETASRAVSGVAAAWVNFNGTGTIATRDSFNVASLTDQSTGQYEINFTSNMDNTSYNASGNANCHANTDNFSSAGFNAVGTSNSSMNGQLVGSISLGSFVSGTGYVDSSLAYLSAHGDLA